jgi:long-chain acyl-CoA synthetase
MNTLIPLTSGDTAMAPTNRITEVMGQTLPADTMGGLFWYRVQSSPDTVGFIFEHDRFTNAEFAQRVGRFRAALRRDGAKRGSRIATFMYNSPDLLALLLACARDGLVFCPVNVALRHNDLAYTLGDIAPFIAFFDGELTEVAVLAAAEAKINRAVVIGDMTSGAADGLIRFDDWLADSAVTEPNPEITPSEPLSIIYSGGTTGLPNCPVTSPFRSILSGCSVITGAPASKLSFFRSIQMTFGAVVSSK